MALETEQVPQRSGADRRRSPGDSPAVSALIDVAVILAFVLLGRNSHAEGLSPASVLQVAGPFLVALGLAWVALASWHRRTGGEAWPAAWARLRDVWPDGVAVWLVTASLGLTMRRLVVGDGTAGSFVVVTCLVLGVGLIGWRAVANTVARRSS